MDANAASSEHERDLEDQREFAQGDDAHVVNRLDREQDIDLRETGGPESMIEVDLSVEEAIDFDDRDPVTRERDEYLDMLRRLQAEFDNYRKRVMRQQSESVARATESLIERLLPVLDALDLALAHHESTQEELGPDRQALTQIAALARDALAKEGLERIDAIEVSFDPKVHDAVIHLDREDDTDESGVIVSEVLRAGYQLKGKVVRPAMVQVRG